VSPRWLLRGRLRVEAGRLVNSGVHMPAPILGHRAEARAHGGRLVHLGCTRGATVKVRTPILEGELLTSIDPRVESLGQSERAQLGASEERQRLSSDFRQARIGVRSFRLCRDQTTARIREVRRRGICSAEEVGRPFIERPSGVIWGAVWLLLALVGCAFLGCANGDSPIGANEGDGKRVCVRNEAQWLHARPANAYPYEEETLRVFARLTEDVRWRGADWSERRMLRVQHAKTGLWFVLLPGGSFTMGSPEDEPGRGDDEMQHEAAVVAFLLCETECSQGAWQRGGGRSESHRMGADLPVEGVSFIDVAGQDGRGSWCARNGLRLPSESEWEYACRAGGVGPWTFGSGEEQLTEYGWYFRNSGHYLLPPDVKLDFSRSGELGCRTHSVATRKPNAWGLFDMHGNVMEWCESQYRPYSDALVGGKADTEEAKWIIVRGGSWLSAAEHCRSACRFSETAKSRAANLGFRPAATVP
jgi:formylglycine-generating enzyme required for sulfatase activity